MPVPHNTVGFCQIFTAHTFLYYSDGLLNIDYSTGITKVPDIIHGELDMKDLSQRYTSAIYNPQGTAASRVRVSRLDIIPKTPFALSTKWWSKYYLVTHTPLILLKKDYCCY